MRRMRRMLPRSADRARLSRFAKTGQALARVV